MIILFFLYDNELPNYANCIHVSNRVEPSSFFHQNLTQFSLFILPKKPEDRHIVKVVISYFMTCMPHAQYFFHIAVMLIMYHSHIWHANLQF